MSKNYLSHSEYDPQKYDAQKAHEYYEETKYKRGLVKGIYKQGNTLNEKGLAAKSDLQLKSAAVKKAKMEYTSERANKKYSLEAQSAKKRIEEHTNKTSKRIERLRIYLDQLPKSMRKIRSQNIEKQIKIMRAQNAAERTRILNSLQNKKTQIESEKTKANAEITSKTKSDLDAAISDLYNNPNYIKSKDTSKKSSTKSTSKKKTSKKSSTKKKTKKESKKRDYSQIIKDFWNYHNKGGK